jgi:hypothetical protein
MAAELRVVPLNFGEKTLQLPKKWTFLSCNHSAEPDRAAGAKRKPRNWLFSLDEKSAKG